MKQKALLLAVLPLIGANSCIFVDNNGKETSVSGKSSYSGETISVNTTWSGDIKVSNWLDVTAVLTIEDCTNILMGNDAYIRIKDGGMIVAQGTEKCPIKFTSDRLVPLAGDWGHVAIESSASAGNILDNVVMEYGNEGMLRIEDKVSVSINNCDFANNSGEAIYLGNDVVLKSFTDNYFDANEGAMIYLNDPNTLVQLEKVSQGKSNGSYIDVGTGHLTKGGTIKNLGEPVRFAEWTYIQDKDLTVAAGNVFWMSQDAWVKVENGASLIAVGTVDDKIVFTSDRTKREAGDWKNIEIAETAGKNSKFDNVLIEYGKEGLMLSQNSVVTNSVFAALSSQAVINHFNKLTFTDNSFVDMGAVDLLKIHPDMMTKLGSVIVPTDNLGRILLDSGYIENGGTWAVQKAPIVMGDWTTIDNEDSEISLTIKDADLRLPKDGRITVDQAALNLENTIVDWNVKNNNWDAIIYTDKSLDSTIKDCTIKNGNVTGDGFLRLNPGSNVDVSNTKFEDSFDHHKCYFWNESDNLSVNFELNKLYHARDCNSENNNL